MTWQTDLDEIEKQAGVAAHRTSEGHKTSHKLARTDVPRLVRFARMLGGTIMCRVDEYDMDDLIARLWEEAGNTVPRLTERDARETIARSSAGSAELEEHLRETFAPPRAQEFWDKAGKS